MKFFEPTVVTGFDSAPSTFWISLPEALSLPLELEPPPEEDDSSSPPQAANASPRHEDRQQGEDGVRASFHVDWMLLLGDTNRRPRDRLCLAWILMPRGVTARWRAAIAASAAKVKSATTMHAASWPAVP